MSNAARTRVPGEDAPALVPAFLLLLGGLFVTTATSVAHSSPAPVVTAVGAPSASAAPSGLAGGPAPASTAGAEPEARSAEAVSAAAAPKPCGRLVIRFASGIVTGPKSAKEPLATLASWLMATGGAEVLVEGHADAVGDDVENLRLSKRRASWVGAQLEAAGVGRERITTRGLGAFSPVGGGRAETESANRRVVVSAVGAQGCAPVPEEEIR